MPKIKRVKIKPAQELYRLKNVKITASDSGEFCTVEVDNGATTFRLGYSPGEVFRVVKHTERNLPESVITRYSDIFEEIEE